MTSVGPAALRVGKGAGGRREGRRAEQQDQGEQNGKRTTFHNSLLRHWTDPDRGGRSGPGSVPAGHDVCIVADIVEKRNGQGKRPSTKFPKRGDERRHF